jgi:hypothetical protein
MLIEMRLHTVGRGRLLQHTQTTREAWVDAIHELYANTDQETRDVQLDGLYALVRLNPGICQLDNG